MKKVVLFLTLALCSFQVIYAQLPAIGPILAGKTKNIVSGGLVGTDNLVLQNTGVVPLQFCMSQTISGSCIGIPAGITVNAGASATITVAALGGTTTAV